MKKFLFVTGRNAKEGLEEVIKKNKLSGKIHLSNVDVASFITPKILLKELSKKELEGIESIILPGNVSGDFSIIEKNFKVKCIKGPTCYHELPYFLKFMDSKKRNGGKKRLWIVRAKYHLHSSRKFWNIWAPYSVCSTSGWNCNPYKGLLLCFIA